MCKHASATLTHVTPMQVSEWEVTSVEQVTSVPTAITACEMEAVYVHWSFALTLLLTLPISPLKKREDLVCDVRQPLPHTPLPHTPFQNHVTHAMHLASQMVSYYYLVAGIAG